MAVCVRLHTPINLQKTGKENLKNSKKPSGAILGSDQVIDRD